MGEERSAYDRLNGQQQSFVDHYLVLRVQGTAAREAGYKSPDKAGYRLMQIPRVLAAIGEKMAGRSKRLQIDADYVLIKAAELADANVLDFCEVLEDGSIKPSLVNVSRETAAAIIEFERKESAGGEVTYKLKLVDPIRALELVGKHTDVRAFLERHSVEDGDDLARAINQAEARVKAGRKTNGDARPEEEQPAS